MTVPGGPELASTGPARTGPAFTEPAFTRLPDLASRRLGGSVIGASDELFAEKENLIKPSAPVFVAGEFGHKGKIYDGWETRRRREPGHDHAIVRLGAPGLVHGVVVDTAYFRGNYPPEISVEATAADGYPSAAELAAAAWQPIVARSPVRGDAVNYFEVGDRRRWSHVRLSIYPDGGVARFRVHGEVVPDPAFLTGTVDLAAAENGGRLLGCSDAFYASPANLIMPGRARVMSDGWENARRRGPGNDYAVFALGAAGQLRQVEIDTSCFVGNAPGWARLLAAHHPGPVDPNPVDPRPVDLRPGDGPGVDEPGTDRLFAADPDPVWCEVLPKTRVQPDTRHRFLVEPRVASHIRLDLYPDGGLARLRIYGEIVPEGVAALRQRWLQTTP